MHPNSQRYNRIASLNCLGSVSLFGKPLALFLDFASGLTVSCSTHRKNRVTMNCCVCSPNNYIFLQYCNWYMPSPLIFMFLIDMVRQSRVGGSVGKKKGRKKSWPERSKTRN